MKVTVDKALIEQAVEALDDFHTDGYRRESCYEIMKALRAALAEPVVEPMRKHVEDFAAKGGWTKGSGEGAFEFVQRVSYAQGVEDGRNRPAQTPPAEHGCKFPLCQTEEYQQMLGAQVARELIGVPLLSVQELYEILSSQPWADDQWDYERAIEAAVRRKAGL